MCKKQYESVSDKGYSTVNKYYFFLCKLHLITSVRGILHSMNITNASVYEVHFLPQFKSKGLNKCTLVAD
ncbi:MAG: transposase [Bacteroidales bacterium]